MKRIQLNEPAEPTPERQRMGQIIQVETIQAGVMTHIDIRSTLLDRYWRDQLLLGGGMDYDLAATRHEAGQRLQMLYEDTGHRKRLTGSYGASTGGYSSGEKRWDQITNEEDDADEKYRGIMRKLTSISPQVASAVVNLCIHDFDPVDRKDLIRGLDMLIRHWGL